MPGVRSHIKTAFIAALESRPGEFEANLQHLTHALGSGLPTRHIRLCVRLGQAAFVEPERTVEIIDRGLAEWSGQPGPEGHGGLEVNPRLMPESLKAYLWDEIENPPDTNRLIKNTEKLWHALGDELKQAYAQSILDCPGLAEAIGVGYLRPPMQLEDLRHHPRGTLGYAFYHQLKDHNLSLEIVPGYQLPPRGANLTGPEYIGRRMFETHDLRHVLLGYSTSGEDEIALQAFELAQAGRSFSANVLVWTSLLTLLSMPDGLPGLLAIIGRGWRHGRQTRPLLGVRWEEHWDQPLEPLRTRYAIRTQAAQV